MNNITIELCAEDRARIDNLTAALLKIADAIAEPSVTYALEEAPKTEPTPEPVAEAPKAEPTPEQVEEPTPAPVAEPEKAQPEKEVTVAELQAKVVQLVNAGKKSEARLVVLSYAMNVGSIPADKRAEVLEKLNALEG